jgi:general secretion pathway protein J
VKSIKDVFTASSETSCVNSDTEQSRPAVIFRRHGLNSVTGDQPGFTLLELLVAITVFTFIAAAAYTGLRSVLFNQAAIEVESKRFAEIQMAFYILAQDIQQAAPRPVKDEYGDSQPALKSDDLDDNILQLTRTGWDNPLGQQRTTLQRLAYRLENGQLIRLYWDTLDRSGISEPRQIILLEGVQSVAVRFLDTENTWQTQWPLPENPGGDIPATSLQQQTLPRAVEWQVSLEDWGDISRLFLLVNA